MTDCATCEHPATAHRVVTIATGDTIPVCRGQAGCSCPTFTSPTPSTVTALALAAATAAGSCGRRACRECTGCAHSNHTTCRGTVRCPDDGRTRTCECCGTPRKDADA